MDDTDPCGHQAEASLDVQTACVNVYSWLGDLIHSVYGEDGMDDRFSERQNIETFALNNREFKHDSRVDVTDPSDDFSPDEVGVPMPSCVVMSAGPGSAPGALSYSYNKVSKVYT